MLYSYYCNRQGKLWREIVNDARDIMWEAVDDVVCRMSNGKIDLLNAVAYVFCAALYNLKISAEANARERVRCRIEADLKEIMNKDKEERIKIIDNLVEGLLEDGGMI